MAEPQTHPGPVTERFLKAYHVDNRRGRKLRKRGKAPRIRRALRRAVRRAGGKDSFAVHWEAAPPRQDHSRCAGQVEEVRAYHKSHGYRDIAYSFLVCIHGQIFVGRGWGQSAATCGTYWNSRADSVCAMIGPGYVPTQAMYDSIRSLILQAQARGMGNIIGHRDACSTQCPGNELWSWVHAGFPGGAPAPPPPPKKKKKGCSGMLAVHLLDAPEVGFPKGGLFVGLPGSWMAVDLFAYAKALDNGALPVTCNGVQWDAINAQVTLGYPNHADWTPIYFRGAPPAEVVGPADVVGVPGRVEDWGLFLKAGIDNIADQVGAEKA